MLKRRQFLSPPWALPRSARWPWLPCPSPCCCRRALTPCRRSCWQRPAPTTGGHAQRLDLALAHEQGVREFHLRRRAGGARDDARLRWPAMGLSNGQSPGPTIEVVEGDRVRIFRHQQARPSCTSVHWHASARPTAWTASAAFHADPRHPAGREFVARRPRHLHVPPARRRDGADGDGMMGLWITHPKARHPLIDEVDRDFCFLLNAFDIEPGSAHAER